MPASRSPRSTSGTSSMCEPDRIDRPDAVHVLRHRGRDDLRRGQPDALVDRPRSRRRGPGRRSARRRWSARPGPACRPAAAAGAPSSSPVSRDPLAHGGQLGPASPTAAADGAETPVGRAVLAEDLAQRAGPLAGRDAGPGRSQRGRHQVLVGLGGVAQPRQRRGRPRPRSRSARHASQARRSPACSASGSAVWIAASRSAVSGMGSVVSNLLTPDDDLLAGLDPARGARRASRPAAASCSRTRPPRPRRPSPGPGRSRPGRPRRARRPCASTTREPVEDVVVLQQVGLVGQHLLHPQRPLLVPRPRQAERLVPGRQLHGAGAGVLATA